MWGAMRHLELLLISTIFLNAMFSRAEESICMRINKDAMATVFTMMDVHSS